MDLKFIQQNPTRRPQWRLDRVMQLIRHRPQPLRPKWMECGAIGIYRHILLELAAARRDEDRRDLVLQQYPEICHAHELHYSADAEPRQILEARLLTTESLERIAQRIGAATKAVEYYEALFFNVRDRLANDFWIRAIIRGKLHESRDDDSAMGIEQRGYVMRLFAYYGGPLALDTVINGFLPGNVPKHDKDVGPWFQDVLSQLVQTSAVVAATSISIDQKNIMRLLQLAMKHRIPADQASTMAANDLENRLRSTLESINRAARGEAGVS